MSRALALASAALVLACSAPLEGELVGEPVDDWTFAAGSDDIDFESPGGLRFRRVLVDTHVYDGALYLVVSTIFSAEDAALDEVLAGGRVRARIEGKRYDLRAARLERAEDIDPFLPSLLRESMGIESEGARWDPEPERYPGTQVRQWFFRLESQPR